MTPAKPPAQAATAQNPLCGICNTLKHSLFDFFFRSYNLNVTLGLQLDTDLLNLLLDPHLLV